MRRNNPRGAPLWSVCVMPRSLRSLMRSVEVLKFKFGEIDIRIGQPRSVREIIARKSARRELALTSPENGTMTLARLRSHRRPH